MKTLLHVLGVAALVVLTCGVAVYWILQPPAPLSLPPRGVSLSGVTVINPGLDRREGQVVSVAGSTIESIEPGPTTTGDPYAGSYVLPGLADLHVHFPPAALPGQAELFAFLFLYHGVTAVRDAGDVDGTATAPARTGVAEGRFPGPRIFACGPFVDGAEPLWGNSIVATTPEEGRRAVETIAAAGFDCVKAYNGLDAATLDAVRAAAREAGIPVIGHVPKGVRYDVARLDDAQHMIGVPPPHPDPAVTFPLILSAWNDLEEHWLDFIAQASLRHRIASTPTLVTVDRLIASQDYARLLDEPELHLLPRFYREVVWNPKGGTSASADLSADDIEMLREAFAKMKQTVATLHARGIEIHTGTDTLIAFVVPGASLHRELRLLVDAGLTPEQVLALSTRDSARFLRDDLGVVRAGAPAELAIFREDPTRSLDGLDTLVAVVRDGRLYSREDLDAQLERYRGHFDGTLYDAIVTPIVRRVLASTTGE